MSDTSIPEDVMKTAEHFLVSPIADEHGNTLLYFVGDQFRGKALHVLAMAILAERERCQWQPIETAPKDGRLVLVTTPGATDFQGYFVAYWGSGIDEWKFHMDGYIRKPSHWMPLPEAPK